MSSLAGAWRGVRWYLAELTGENQYDRYLERHAREHPGTPPLPRREFEAFLRTEMRSIEDILARLGLAQPREVD